MQAVVPDSIASNVQTTFCLGEVYILSTFVVEHYKSDELYKCINYDKYILLTKNTEIHHYPEVGESIKLNAFDFYDLQQTTNLAHFDIFLTGKYSYIHVKFLNCELEISTYLILLRLRSYWSVRH